MFHLSCDLTTQRCENWHNLSQSWDLQHSDTGIHWFLRRGLLRRIYDKRVLIKMFQVAVITLNGDSYRDSSLGSWASFSSSDWSKDNDAAFSLADMKLGWYIGTLPHPRVQLVVSAYFIRTHTYLLITPRLAITTPPLCRHKTHHPWANNINIVRCLVRDAQSH